MSTDKPLPPPGRPNVAQRVAAIQLASRSHSSTSPSKVTVVSRGRALPLPPPPSSTPSINHPIPTMIIFTTPVRMPEDSDMEGDDTPVMKIHKSNRPRFFRFKNKDKYPRIEDVETKENVNSLE